MPFEICSVLSIQNSASFLLVMEMKTRTKKGTLGAAGCYIWKTTTFVVSVTTPRILSLFSFLEFTEMVYTPATYEIYLVAHHMHIS